MKESRILVLAVYMCVLVLAHLTHDQFNHLKAEQKAERACWAAVADGSYDVSLFSQCMDDYANR